MKKAFFLSLLLLVLVSCAIEEKINASNIEENIDLLDYPTTEIEVPFQGIIEEYLTLSATNLKANKLKFKFNDILTDAYQYNTDTVKVQVTRALDAVNSQIKIYKSSNDSLIHTSSFQLKAPLISGVEKTIVEFDESIWIYGNNFDIDPSYLEVKLNGNSVNINETSTNSIQIIIPNTINDQNIDISVYAQLQQVNVQQIMSLKVPEITSTDQTVNVGGIMEIEGVNFNTNPENGQFIINNEIVANTVSIENTGLARIRVPYGPYEAFEIFKISYETAGMQTEFNTNITIDSDYILYTKNNIYPSSNVRHFNNKSYAFVNDSQDANGVPINDLYELDYTTRAWTKINTVSFLGYSFRETITDNGELFVFATQYGSTSNSFYKVDLNNFSITTIVNPINNSLRSSPAFFYFNNQIIFGKGRQGNGATDNYYTDLYSYNISSQSWTTLASDNSEFYSDNDYNFQNSKYISTYTVQTGTIDELNIFDPLNNTFTAVIPSSFYQTENVFNYLNKLMRVNLIQSIDQSYFYEYNSQNLITTLDTQQLQSTSKYFAKDDKVFFYSSITNNAYAPSNGFYLLNPNISNQF
ncbi:IPT/TIG domain-containing protein [Lacinutrix jangbogonensis]|uniref:IPT/TIG domain-containing protein n=1 Tax=Lacinutrix jangbogonensis TaxID=1469557 RepID=UPI00053EB436|nr:IPT/TIG domain-containing protein [Lacinutrix jangbogonensis]